MTQISPMKHSLQLISIIALNLFVFSGAHGQIWSAQTSNTNIDLHDINFFDDNTGYAFGDTLSTVVKTTNAGDLWSGLNPVFTDVELLSSAFLGSNSAVIAVGTHDVLGGKGVVIKTSNGGSSWTTDTSIVEKLFDVSFASSTDGWISGENGYIAHTTNGGTTWTQLTTGTGEDIFSIDFVDANEGWGVGTVDSQAMILHTTNAGTNWTQQNSGVVEPLHSVFFVNNTTGWAVGANGAIIATTDGGANWSLQTSGVLNVLFDVYFLDVLKGWAVGGAGTVLKTTDGGTNWTQELSGTTTDIHSITMRNENLGWLCGDGGEIRMYGLDPTAINEVNKWRVDVAVYPNPANDWLSIDIKNAEGDWSYALYDILGKLVVEHKSNQTKMLFNRNEIIDGLYFLKISNSEGIAYTEKVIFN